MGSQPARKCWDGLALNCKDQGQTRKARFVSCVSALQLSRITSQPELFQGEKEPNRPLFAGSALLPPHQSVPGVSPPATLHYRAEFPARGPLVTPCHSGKSCTWETSKVDAGLQPRAGRTAADPAVCSDPGCRLVISEGSAGEAGCASTATPACH